MHPGVADRQQQAGDADGEQQQQGQEVLAELLQGRRPLIAQPTAHGQQHASDDQQGRPHETVEDDETEQRMDGELVRRETEHVDAIACQVAGHRLEVDPAENEREDDGEGGEAAPHDEEVGGPTRAGLRRQMKRLPAKSATRRKSKRRL